MVTGWEKGENAKRTFRQTASHSKQVGKFGDDFGGDHFDRNRSGLRES